MKLFFSCFGVFFSLSFQCFLCVFSEYWVTSLFFNLDLAVACFCLKVSNGDNKFWICYIHSFSYFCQQFSHFLHFEVFFCILAPPTACATTILSANWLIHLKCFLTYAIRHNELLLFNFCLIINHRLLSRVSKLLFLLYYVIKKFWYTVQMLIFYAFVKSSCYTDMNIIHDWKQFNTCKHKQRV